MTTGTDTLDRKMVGRYIECITAHPGSPIVITDPHCPDISVQPGFGNVLSGKLVHIMFTRGPVMVVSWLPRHHVQQLIDAYGETV